MNYIIKGELVDTHGGDYIYRDVWYEYQDEKEGYIFYESYYGAKPEPEEIITDIDTINELKRECDIPILGDKIICESGFGYDIGFYINDTSNQYHHCTVRLISNKYIDNTSEYEISRVFPYNEENIKKMVNEYGYEHKYEDYEQSDM